MRYLKVVQVRRRTTSTLHDVAQSIIQPSDLRIMSRRSSTVLLQNDDIHHSSNQCHENDDSISYG